MENAGGDVVSREDVVFRSGWISLVSGVVLVANHVLFDTPRPTFWLGVGAIPAALLMIVAGNRARRSSADPREPL